MSIAPLLSRPSVRGIEARLGIERFAVQLCAALNAPPVIVRWSSSTSTAAMSASGTMYLADPGDAATVTRQTLARYAGFVVHELLHRVYTDFTANSRFPYVAALHNAVEDAWIERRAIRAGVTGNIDGLLRALLGGMVDQAMTVVGDWADPAQYPFSLAVYCRDYGITVPVPHQILGIWQEARSRIDACQNSSDTLAVAEWVYAQLQLNPDQQQPQQPDQGDDQGDDGQQQGDDGQQQADDGEGADGEGQGDDGEGQGDEGQGKGAGKGTPQPADAGPVKAKPGQFQPAMEVEPSLEPGDAAPGGSYSSTDVLVGKAPSGPLPWPLWGGDARITARLRHEVRRIFENSGREWRDAGFKSGALHRPALARVGTGSVDIFSRRMSSDGVDSAVVILLDVSASMFPMGTGSLRGLSLEEARSKVPPSRINTAVGACSVLLDTMAQAGAETMVIAFGEQSYLMKGFSQPWRRVLPSIQAVTMEGNTNDYAAARYATEALMRHPAERKIILAITDGQGQISKTRSQLDAARALGIRVIGLGIQYDVTETYGPESVSIQTVADLGTVAFSKMKRAA